MALHIVCDAALLCLRACAAGEDARVRVRFVDFAHTFLLEHEKQQRDHNFLAGLRAIVARMSAVMRLDTADTLA